MENVDSIGLVVLRWIHCSAGKSKNVKSTSLSLLRHFTAAGYFASYFAMNVSNALSAFSFVSAIEISWRSAFAFACTERGSLLRMFPVL